MAGWGGAFLLRAVNAIANGLPMSLLALFLVTTITGFSLSLILSVIYRRLIERSPVVTWGGTAIVLFMAVLVYAGIDAWVQGLYYSGFSDTSFAQRFIGITFIPLTLLGGWSALYYAINFFLTVEQQADRLERLEAQATAAQLAMLRYQLNPHFLFNTLNSISTLVLLKQTDQANAMLTRLSGFLRHTLITEPGSQVTLAQEIETLQLYLDIERMRFEERLRTSFEIEEPAMHATLPSMLLQPLVENAIKYAVSPQEEGARISLTARVVGRRLRISVEDTGPGMEAPVVEAPVSTGAPGGGESGQSAQLSMLDRLTQPAPQANPTATSDTEATGQPISTGVGIANIRNRLMQGYGPDHLFETRSQAGGGFTVLIEIPYEPAADSPYAAQPPLAEAKPSAALTPPPTPSPTPSPTGPETPDNPSATVIPLNPPLKPPQKPKGAIGNS